MKKKLNEQFRRMQKIAGIINENQINEESYSSDKMLELVKMYVDNHFDEGMEAEAALRKVDEILDGKLDDYDKAFLKGEEDLYENQINEMDVETILTNNGIDDDYFESMGGKEIETGTEEWLDILSDVTGKDAYIAEFDEADEAKIQAFMQKLEALGIELI